MVLSGSLLLAGCATNPSIDGQAVATESTVTAPTSSGELHTIPRTTNRPSDPPLPSDYNQSTNNQLSPQEASLNQLWAAANSEAGADATSSTFSGAAGLTDFAAAVAGRCYPLLSPDDSAALEQLRLGYESQTGEAAFDAAKLYFERATALCM
ncbi:MAG: hypothetical protein JWQ19_3778 [Subtercola sp.]|nr:hypothetical protein [Subtercola sp.]